MIPATGGLVARECPRGQYLISKNGIPARAPTLPLHATVVLDPPAATTGECLELTWPRASLASRAARRPACGNHRGCSRGFSCEHSSRTGPCRWHPDGHIGHVRKTSLAQAKANLSKIVDEAEHHRKRIVILRHGK